MVNGYFERTAQIVGTRTSDEERYDREVLRWLERGKSIEKAIRKANEKYPAEALAVAADGGDDVRAHYEYLLAHARIERHLQGR